MNENSGKDISDIIKKEFDASITLETTEKMTFEEVRNALALQIRQLLKENRQLLFASLYRIDVSEKDVREALENNDTAMVLAGLILNKLNEKLYWRNLYRSKNPDEEKLF
jgi:hypothetical protein